MLCSCGTASADLLSMSLFITTSSMFEELFGHADMRALLRGPSICEKIVR